MNGISVLINEAQEAPPPPHVVTATKTASSKGTGLSPLLSSSPVRTPKSQLAAEQPSMGMLEPTKKRYALSKDEGKAATRQ